MNVLEVHVLFDYKLCLSCDLKKGGTPDISHHLTATAVCLVILNKDYSKVLYYCDSACRIQLAAFRLFDLTSQGSLASEP